MIELIAQLYNNKTMKRSEPFQVDRDELGRELAKMIGEEAIDDTVVIVVMEKIAPSEEFQFTLAPLFRASDFINLFGAENHGREKIQSTA